MDAVEEDVLDLRLQVHLPDGTFSGAYRLVPRWESCWPLATGGSAAAVAGDVTASSTSSGGAVLPIALPPSEMLTLILTHGALVTPVPLTSCESKQSVRDLNSIEGKLYLNLEVNPILGRAIVRVFEVDQETKWQTTGVYSMDPASPILNPLFGLENFFGNKPVYFHGKQAEEIQFPPLKINFQKNFHLHKPIGRGNEGKVYLCSANFSPNYFAVKEVDQSNLLKSEIPDEPSDVSLLARLDHKNVIELYLAWSEAEKTHRFGHAIGSVFVAMKPCIRSLKKYLKETPGTNVEDSQSIFRQLMEGISFLHGCGIAHRDIKPANVLLENDLTVKITDFGIAKEKSPNVLQFNGGVYGCYPYCAPELIDSCSQHNELVDIFSTVMVYFELFMPGLYERNERLKHLNKVVEQHARNFDLIGRPPEVPGAQEACAFDLDAALSGTDVIDDWRGDLKLLQKMINPDHKERASALKILELLDNRIVNDVDHSDGSTGTKEGGFGARVGALPEHLHRPLRPPSRWKTNLESRRR